MHNAKRKVESGDSLQIPVALAAPRGRPPKNASKRLRSWYERGPQSKKKRNYCCGLCGLSGHTAKQCELRQIFDEEVAKQNENK